VWIDGRTVRLPRVYRGDVAQPNTKQINKMLIEVSDVNLVYTKVVPVYNIP
jgi:hypothetical protein